MKKSILALVLVGVVALTAGCESKSSADESTKVTTTTEAPAPTTTTTQAPVTTTTEAPTTTTTINVDVIKETVSDNCYGTLWDGEKKISDDVVRLLHISGSPASPATIQTARKAVQTMKDSAAACKGYVSDDFYSAMVDLADATSDLVDLYVS